MRRHLPAAAIAAALTLAAVPAMAQTTPLPPDLPYGGTLVIDDRDPNFITFTATGFAFGARWNIDTLSGGTMILPSPGGGTASVTLPDVVGGPSPTSYYGINGAVLLHSAAQSTPFSGFVFSPPFAPLEGTSAVLAATSATGPFDTPPYEGSFASLIGVYVLPAIWPPYGTINQQGLGSSSVVPQDGHSETISLFNGEVTVTFISEPIPEPATLALLGAGLVGLGAIRRRKAA